MNALLAVIPEAAQPLSGTAKNTDGAACGGPGSPRRYGRDDRPQNSAELPIAGYASLFWARDLNDDVVAAGAFSASLARAGPGGIAMLYQHEARSPIGVWDEAVEDDRGLFVRGRIIVASSEAQLAAALVRAGALDGLSIGFRAVHARTDASRRLRVLTQVDLAEVSLVSFPMLPGARLFPSPVAGEGGARSA